MSNLTLREIQESGNIIVKLDAINGLLITRHGQHTVNYWSSNDNNQTFYNYDCKTIY